MKKLRIYLSVLLIAVLCVLTMPFGGTAYADTQVYVGGFPIGISLDVGGLLVESVTGVETEYGTAYVQGINKGDIITKLGGVAVSSVDDMQGVLTDAETEIELIRNGENISITVKPIIEAFTQKPRLGVKIKDRIYGIGTVSLVRADGSYAALGHEIYDGETSTHLMSAHGKIHACKILGIKQGHKNEAGALLASIVADTDYGTINCNNNFGISGKYTAEIPDKELMPVADRSEVKPGAAKIKTTISDKPEYFDIEIIKATKQNGKKEKGIVFRVTDERLLEATGGVVRGMSGSPIVQDGKLVGAVTHVFLSDFTKGYGVYVDCLN